MKTRREFFKDSAKILTSGLVGASLLNKLAKPTYANDPIELASKKKIKYRILGRTKLKVSVISFGTIQTRSNVLRYGIRKGINFIHTSIGYSGGKSIREVGKAIRGRRKRVILGLKVTWDWSSDRRLDEALRILGTDYVDILFFNIHNNPKLVASRSAKRAFDRWKREGKVRFMGLTTHGGMKKCMESALKTDWYDCLMPTYTLNMHDDYQEIFEKCKEQNVGFIAMKTGIRPSRPELIQSMLKEKALTTICRTMTSISDVDGYIQATNKKISSTDYNQTLKLSSALFAGRCMMCGTCTANCPQNIPVNDIVRCINYYLDDMKSPEISTEVFDEINGKSALNRCIDCGTCEQHCPQQLPIRNIFTRAKRVFC